MRFQSRLAVVAVIASTAVLAGCSLVHESDKVLRGPEGAAVEIVAATGRVDADESWLVLHPDIKANTTREAYIECFLANADGEPKGPLPVDLDNSRVPSDNVVVEFGVKYSVVDTREADGVIYVEVRAEGPQGTAVTSVLLSTEPPREDGELVGGYSLAGTVPDDPCLVGSDALLDRLRSES